MDYPPNVKAVPSSLNVAADVPFNLKESRISQGWLDQHRFKNWRKHGTTRLDKAIPRRNHGL